MARFDRESRGDFDCRYDMAKADPDLNRALEPYSFKWGEPQRWKRCATQINFLYSQ
jgi:hypothetical protein